MSYRPITDVWILARPKVKYYGAYPNGFLERAKALMGVNRSDSVLHVCGGAAKQYPNWNKFCPFDYTLDADASLKPDFVHDARTRLPWRPLGNGAAHAWAGILCDPPYTEADAEKYAVGVSVLPTANQLLRAALDAVVHGGRVGMLHYVLPQPPREGVRFVACVGVIVGYNNRMRVFSVFEKETTPATSREEVWTQEHAITSSASAAKS